MGGGIAGVSLAWLLDGVHDVTLLESDAELGGHARSIDVTLPGGRRVVVDAGAQYFGPKSHPTYWRLVRSVLGVPTVAAPMNLTVSAYQTQAALLVSPDVRRTAPLLRPRFWPALASLAAFTAGGKALERDGDWSLTAEEFVGRLPIPRSVRDGVLFPLCGAMFGFSVPQVKQMSARSVVAFVIRGLGDGLLAPYDYHNATNGLRAVVEALSAGLTTVTSHVGAGATGLRRSGGVYRVTDARGRVHEADHVVLAAPPYAAGPLAGQLAGAGVAAQACARFPYLPARLAVHHDPAYMPARRRAWSGFNVLTDGDFCEPSMWYGGFRDFGIFKSWISHRREPPRDTVATFDYRHAHETPEYHRAQTALAGVQGTGNLWFAGSHLTDVCSQESALLSAVRVAERLAPDAEHLRRLSPPVA
ncbi:NAD/FAD-binding protein [Mangrovihabitans endophyticus]|uniref:NAD/FAD-binding protein n=1 Tax=Mangrovihabitans endophyticus TaxID=1751298 RepID=A0A8J3BWF9_9ACTN|nr:NAD/FAD-binding protein [Mangrovihabitans endophyticus]